MFPVVPVVLMMLRSVLCRVMKRARNVCQVVLDVKRGITVHVPACFCDGQPSEYSGFQGNRFPVYFFVTAIFGQALFQSADRPGFRVLRFSIVPKVFAATAPCRLLEKLFRHVDATHSFSSGGTHARAENVSFPTGSSVSSLRDFFRVLMSSRRKICVPTPNRKTRTRQDDLI